MFISLFNFRFLRNYRETEPCQKSNVELFTKVVIYLTKSLTIFPKTFRCLTRLTTFYVFLSFKSIPCLPYYEKRIWMIWNSSLQRVLPVAPCPTNIYSYTSLRQVIQFHKILCANFFVSISLIKHFKSNQWSTSLTYII